MSDDRMVTSLDDSIRDVTSHMSDNEKADLLLYAIRSLSGCSRTVIENAVRSCLQLSTLSPEVTAKALVFRANARLTVGCHFGAQIDIQAALAAEPHNVEAKALLHKQLGTPEQVLGCQLQKINILPKQLFLQLKNAGRISNEVWREIALYLPRRDLKTLLFVPHTLSRVASQLLFRKLDLHFEEHLYDEDDDEQPSKRRRLDGRYADILTRIIIDSGFASLVRTVRIYAPPNSYPRLDVPTTFETGMLANALPKLINLRNVHISASFSGLSRILRILKSSSPRIRGLSLQLLAGCGELDFLEFKHLVQFSYTTNVQNPVQVHDLVIQNQNSLRALSLQNRAWPFTTDMWPIRNLTHIDFFGEFPANSEAFTDILSNGHQLESLSLKCILRCMGSSQFRAMPSSVPFLRHFTFTVLSVSRGDADLFPAIAEFLRGRKYLRTLWLMVPREFQGLLGFDASVWGVLPSLTNLKGLALTFPGDLSPGLASWLIPRGVLTLTLNCGSISACESFLNKIRAGIPPGLRYIGLSKFPCSALEVVEQGFPMVRLVRIGHNYWTVVKEDEVTTTEPWPRRRKMYHATEWLEWFGCEDAQDPDQSEFLY